MLGVFRYYNADDAEEIEKAVVVMDELVQELVLKMGCSIYRLNLPEQRLIMPKRKSW